MIASGPTGSRPGALDTLFPGESEQSSVLDPATDSLDPVVGDPATGDPATGDPATDVTDREPDDPDPDDPDPDDPEPGGPAADVTDPGPPALIPPALVPPALFLPRSESGSWNFDPGWVLTAQPYRRTGPLLARAAWFLLVQALEAPLEQESLGDDLRLAAERLVIEGLLTEDGSLTGDGYLVAEILRSPVSMVRVDTLGPEHRGTMEILLDFDLGVSLATTGPTGSHPVPRDVDSRGIAIDPDTLGGRLTDQRHPRDRADSPDLTDPRDRADSVIGRQGMCGSATDPRDRADSPDLTAGDFEAPMGLEVFELGWAPATIASWTGSGPAVAWDDEDWGTEPVTMSSAVLQARLAAASATTPPSDVPAVLADLWRTPWLLWELKTWPSGERLLVLRIGNRYPLLLSSGTSRTADRVTLTPVSPHTLWRTLIALVRRALVTGADELR